MTFDESGFGLAAGWRYLTVNFSAQTLWLAAHLVHSFTFFFFNFVLYLMHRYNILVRYKIQPHRYPSDELYRECLTHVVVKHVVVLPIISYALWPLAEYCGIHASAQLPSLWEISWHLLAYILIQDTLFYWSHRMLHIPGIYQRIHKRHHRFYTPVGIASEFAHPIEDIFNDGAFVVPPLLLGGHIFTLYLWMFIRILEITDGHAGYAFPFPLSPFGLLGVAEHHDYHHSQNKGCYGSFFYLWDRICGTDAEFKKWKAEQQAKKNNIKEGKPKEE